MLSLLAVNLGSLFVDLSVGFADILLMDNQDGVVYGLKILQYDSLTFSHY